MYFGVTHSPSYVDIKFFKNKLLSKIISQVFLVEENLGGPP